MQSRSLNHVRVMDGDVGTEGSRSEKLPGLSGSKIYGFPFCNFSHHVSRKYDILAQTQDIIRFLLPRQRPRTGTSTDGMEESWLPGGHFRDLCGVPRALPLCLQSCEA